MPRQEKNASEKPKQVEKGGSHPCMRASVCVNVGRTPYRGPLYFLSPFRSLLDLFFCSASVRFSSPYSTPLRARTCANCCLVIRCALLFLLLLSLLFFFPLNLLLLLLRAPVSFDSLSIDISMHFLLYFSFNGFLVSISVCSFLLLHLLFVLQVFLDSLAVDIFMFVRSKIIGEN